MEEQLKPRVVVIGGGTGMPVLLRGLKTLPIHLSVLVSVADDGGSTGRIRQEIEMPAPGDIRNVIAALSDVEPILVDLFQHRFDVKNGLAGHSLGNLLLAALSSVTGDFYTGIKEISRVLNVKGHIFPISNESMVLNAEMEDGSIVAGESKIPLANKRIKRVFLTPDEITPLPHAIKAIQQADLIIISPGSLYTSILPNLIIPKIGDTIKEASGQVVYVCNVMTQAGETTGYKASDHIQAIRDHIGETCVDSIIVHNEKINKYMREIYAEENAEPVIYDIETLIEMNLKIIESDIIDNTQQMLRHDTDKIARILYSLINKDEKT